MRRIPPAKEQPAPTAKTLLRQWKDAENETMQEAFVLHASGSLTRGEIMGGLMEVRIMDWEGLDEVRVSLGLRPYRRPTIDSE